MIRLILKAKAALDLGLMDVLKVLWYKALLKYRLHPVCAIMAAVPEGPFFSQSTFPDTGLSPISSWKTSRRLFGYLDIRLEDEPPIWLENPIGIDRKRLQLLPWWEIADFDDSVGDIKLIWEQSRMNWVVAFAQRARNGDKAALDHINVWLSDWLKSNPPYLGANWKCGQEAAIRLIHLCCAAVILGQERGTLSGLQDVIRLHLRRIEPTLDYAVSQNNNHGTSEAAALFIGGSWLAAEGAVDGPKYEKLGRSLLVNRACKLIEEDGSFSQYSLNYHRMLLDTFSIVEIWRQKLLCERFPSVFYHKASLATSWLYQMVCPKSGDGPNFGANDGSLLMQLTDSSYRDFRPSVHLACVLFQNRQAYSQVSFCDLHLAWLGIGSGLFKPQEYLNCDFDSGGYKILRSSDAKVIFRYPKFKFRPSQADAMHIDLWVNGYNFLGDAGSYSYNSVPDMSAYFNGTIGHNTVQFDDRDQMPRLGRFLFGSWLKTKQLSQIMVRNGNVSCFASYIDYKGAEHSRTINLNGASLNVIDRVKGFKKKSIIRWRLPDGEWILKHIENCVVISNDMCSLTVSSDRLIVRADIIKGWKSMYYMKKESVSVLEVEISCAGIFTTDVRWHQ